MKIKLPQILLFAYVVLFVSCGISPADRPTWWAENIPILLIVAALVYISRKYQFSKLSLIFMSFLIAMHTIGGHFTFSNVPFDWVTDFFGFQRNHYDRIAHFTVGFYAYPIAEAMLKRQLVSTKWILYLFPVFSIFFIAGAYEIFEWIFAILADPDAGIAVLGSQGDIWDAQKDILADALGSIFAMFVFWIINRNSINSEL
jgi:putative membrane protein